MKKITIIGGGPAGYAAALYANNFDLEVTLVESDVLGGTCLNEDASLQNTGYMLLN